jgi:flavin reductase (DIM6/NTAB) family NADH-FMN oxidoreductase RutF
MVEKFRHINIRDITDNTFNAIGNDWMLITAGDLSSFNMMTANWGSFGVLWHRPIAICFVRPQRYTYQFIEKSDHFTLCFLEDQYKEALNLCGSISGRNVNKTAATGLTPMETTLGSIYFEQARIVLECHKIYADNLKPDNFLVKDIINEVYSKSDFHKFYIGEIISCLKKNY